MPETDIDRVGGYSGSKTRGTSGGGWHNVSWAGKWDIDLGAVTSPVLLWYCRKDRFAPPAHRLWLSQHLLRARLVLRDGEGHLAI